MHIDLKSKVILHTQDSTIESSWVGCFLEFNVDIDFSLIFIYCRVSSGK